ncbi:MAG: zinc metallopeptidase [Cytophagales bacterium]|nr:MAG: zinc metallopeptidase [Cytophagales bacterium]
MTILIISVITMLVSLFVSWRLKSKFKEYSQIGLKSGISGKEVAEQMLKDHQIYDVRIISVDGQLTDHYNPADRTVNLSYDVYHGRNAAAVAVSAHECGHAVQHATAYSMLGLRSKMVPIQNISAKVLNIVMMVMMFGGFMLHGSGMFNTVLPIIVACNLVITLFALVTLPVEFDASNRALAWIDRRNVVTSQEHEMAKDALNWAALTYVVAALGSLAQLLYYVSLLLGRRDD